MVGLRIGSTSLFGRSWIQPVIGVENLTDRTYAPSLVLNSASARYFEPAPGRALFASLTVTAP